jgi:hypothetical protein
VELLGETPNGLSASPTLANGDRECQYYFLRVADSSSRSSASISSACHGVSISTGFGDPNALKLSVYRDGGGSSGSAVGFDLAKPPRT